MTFNFSYILYHKPRGSGSTGCGTNNISNRQPWQNYQTNLSLPAVNSLASPPSPIQQQQPPPPPPPPPLPQYSPPQYPSLPPQYPPPPPQYLVTPPSNVPPSPPSSSSIAPPPPSNAPLPNTPMYYPQNRDEKKSVLNKLQPLPPRDDPNAPPKPLNLPPLPPTKTQPPKPAPIDQPVSTNSLNSGAFTNNPTFNSNANHANHSTFLPTPTPTPTSHSSSPSPSTSYYQSQTPSTQARVSFETCESDSNNIIFNDQELAKVQQVFAQPRNIGKDNIFIDIDHHNKETPSHFNEHLIEVPMVANPTTIIKKENISNSDTSSPPPSS